ncbi:hypothetical protein [Actinomadura oligospora]|uniref:hypothetical protein n=1 Tax=Actinomadura oligospora TaxID=111804 RepID=UPI0012F888D4|nr:hypothetical protein [Actinomadura oligospora]
MNLDDLERMFAQIDEPLTFVRRPDPVPGDLRFGWRFSVLTLILNHCYRRTANLQQVHFLSWAIKSRESRDLVARVLSGKRRPEDIIVRYDPSLSRTLGLAQKFSLVHRNNNQTISLAQQGLILASEILRQSELLVAEKDFLNRFPAKITQSYVRDLVG